MSRVCFLDRKTRATLKKICEKCPGFASWIEKLANYKISKTETSFFRDIAGNFFRV